MSAGQKGWLCEPDSRPECYHAALWLGARVDAGSNLHSLCNGGQSP